MNKPAYAAIKTHSPTQPVIIFVSSRRQTALTAQDLITYCGMEDNPRRFLWLTEDELEAMLSRVVDETLKNDGSNRYALFYSFAPSLLKIPKIRYVPPRPSAVRQHRHC